MPHFVQFLHPGIEHKPPPGGVEKGWNYGPHRRCLLEGRGTWTDGTKVDGPGRIEFWGEWEGPARLNSDYRPHPDAKPRYLWRPYYSSPNPIEGVQGTDPFVFGGFFYCNCRQWKDGRRMFLQRLDRGSMILFGSHKAGRFVLDTVFVVKSAEPLSRENWRSIDVPDLFRKVQLEPLFCSGRSTALKRGGCDGGSDFTLYRGATIEDRVDDMYSYVPCLPAKSPTGFARPSIKLELVNPNLPQGAAGKRSRSLDTVRAQWLSTKGQIAAAGLSQGVSVAPVSVER